MDRIRRPTKPDRQEPGCGSPAGTFVGFVGLDVTNNVRVVVTPNGSGELPRRRELPHLPPHHRWHAPTSDSIGEAVSSHRPALIGAFAGMSALGGLLLNRIFPGHLFSTGLAALTGATIGTTLLATTLGDGQ